MPQYLFERESTGEIKEVFYHMNDDKNYKGESGEETDWKRIFTAPQASIDTGYDPFNQNHFIEKTKGKGTYGDLVDRAAEDSEKRAAKRDGVDPVKETYYKDYSNKRKGKKHPKQIQEQLKKTVIDI